MLRIANRSTLTLLPAILLLLGGVTPTRAQESWVYSPYQIKVWVAYDSSPFWNKARRAQIAKRFEDWSYVHAKATWKIDVAEPVANIRADILHDETIDVDNALAAEPKAVTEGDKLMVVGFHDERTQYRVTACELDCRTRTWGPVITKVVRQPRLVAQEAFSAVSEAFLPIARVETSKGKDATALPRAAGLIESKESPASIREGHVMRAIVRRNNRKGEPLDGGIVEIPWTYLFIRGETGDQEFMLKCRVYSSHSNPITSRKSSRTLRMAVMAKPLFDTTVVQLQSKEEVPQRLQGYNLYSRDPSMSESEPLRKAKSTLLGQTDWRGFYKVEKGEFAMRVLYVRNGQQVIARLPIVPGMRERSIGILPNDDYRLQAEAYVTGIQHAIMDLVIQREVLAARVKYLAKNDKAKEGGDLIDEFSKMTTKEQIRNMVDGKRAELTAMLTANGSMDNRTASKIDRLFSITRKILDQYVDTELPNKLQQFVKDPSEDNETRLFGKDPNAVEDEAKKQQP